jgi:hypothetical protein
MKSQIIEQLGQTDIRLPSLIGEGPAANDRVKTHLSVLQAAARHARDPRGSRFNLAEECQAAGVDVIDGETGAIYPGRCRTRVERPNAELSEIERWRGKVA